jgi:hypothetical protein
MGNYPPKITPGGKFHICFFFLWISLRSPINNVYRHNNFQRPPDQRELVIIDLK